MLEDKFDPYRKFVLEIDPMSSGLDKGVVLRLLMCNNRPDKKDRAKYEKTEHFQNLSNMALGIYRTCTLCNRSKGLVAHHRHYRSLFREHLLRDVVVLCNRCHGKYHRGVKR